MQMTYEQAMRPGMLLEFANRRGSGYMMRSEKRTGSYGNGSGRRPPKRRAGFFYIFITLLLCLLLWPLGMVMLWRRKVRLQAGTKLLISLLTLCLSIFLIVFVLTVPVDNPEFTAFQDRANDWLDQAAANVATAGDAAYKKGTETWQIMSDFSLACSDYSMLQTADLIDQGVDLAGKTRTAITKLFPNEADVTAEKTAEPRATKSPADTRAPAKTEAPETTDAPADDEVSAQAGETAAPSDGEDGEADALNIRLPDTAPDAEAAQPLAAGALHADGSFTPAEVSAPEATETAEPETWTAVEDVTAAPTEAPTDAPTEAPTDAPTQAPAEAPTQAPAEAPAEVSAPEAEAPTEEPAASIEAPATPLAEETPEAIAEAAEAPVGEDAGTTEEAPVEAAEAPADDGVMVPVEPTPEATPEASAEATPEATAATSEISFQIKPASAATVYYFENGGKGFHANPEAHGLHNIPAHTLAEAFATGKSTCNSCGMPPKSILDETYIAWVDEKNRIHTTDECASFSGRWRLLPLAEAVEAGYARCPDCNADVYVESIFPTPTSTPTPEVVTPSTPLKSAGEITVYYFDVSHGYHAAAKCVGMNNAPAHTLAEAVAAGKRACGNCKPVSADLIGLPMLWLDEIGVCHTSDGCSSFIGKYALIARDDALAQGLAACTDCGAAEYLIPGTVLAGY